MKLVYCIASVYNPGGMERVLLNKLRWFVRQGGYELLVVTTDQAGRPPFYDFPQEVRMIDLGINYSADNNCSAPVKIWRYFCKRPLHRKRLTELLMQERPAITVSLFPSESSFIPSIRDGSRKVLELHHCKFFRLQYRRGGLLGFADRFRTWQDERIVRRFDKFVVLTREDSTFWGDLPNLTVIPNAAVATPITGYNVKSQRVIAVGRLDYQKSFDRLLDAWAMLPQDLRDTWQLDIFGKGEWEDRLLGQISRLGIADSASIHAPVGSIFDEYAASAFLVMSSHYEGLPMVMIEAMGCGLPVVSFDFKCGPQDIIAQEVNGLIVPDGDLGALAAGMEKLMRDDALRLRMSEQAQKITDVYSEKAVMAQWEDCFRSIL